MAGMNAANRRKPKMKSPVLGHYTEQFAERGRLGKYAQLEFFRTKEIIARHLPKKPTVILDVGGGPGHYALWLSEVGDLGCPGAPVSLPLRPGDGAFLS